jgi:predicted MFS family arabinose efflux permease
VTNVEQSYSRGSIYAPLSILAVGLFAVGTNAFVIAGLLPDIAADFGVTAHEVSYSITFYSIVVAVGAPVLSILLPRMSRTRLMALGLLVFTLGTVVAALAPTLAVFVLGRVVAAVGGAALVPTATAAAAAIAKPEQRGRALGFVGLGFSLATALGSPLGTAIGAAGGWRLPILVLAGISALTALAVAVGVRGIPVGPAVGFLARFAPLRDTRLIATLVTTVLLTAGFNVVYIFSSGVTADATGGDARMLAILLLAYGVTGIIGNAGAGPLTDRIGNRISASTALIVEIVVFLLLPFLDRSFAATAVLFAVWGIVAFAAVVPVQHRLVAIDPAASGIVLSWYSTAMYGGIALAPILGSATSATVGVRDVPFTAAIVTALALIVFQFAYARRPRLAAAEPAQ